MRQLAIGDIHGCFTALSTLLKFVDLQSHDLVIALGDYVDHGPRTADCLNRLIDLSVRHRLIALRGNHDLLMLNAQQDSAAFETWLEKGGDLTLVSYGLPPVASRLEDIAPRHWRFLKNTLPYYNELPHHFFVHANAAPNVPLAEQSDWMLYWEKFNNPAPHESGKIMVCGHTSQRSGLPVNAGHAVCIDTRVYDSGWLTCLEINTGQLWQANEQGQTRHLNLADMPTSV